MPANASPRRSDAAWVAALVALDPIGLGGVVLRSAAGEGRDAWLRCLVDLAPAALPVRRVPLHVDDDRLLGGLDLAATLQAGRVVAERGLLAAADGGLLVLAMAERIEPPTAARIAAALDAFGTDTARSAPAGRAPLRVGAVALDEGLGDDEAVPARLAERLAFRLVLGTDADGTPASSRADVDAARLALPAVSAPDDVVEALCAAAFALGADSIRAPLFALRAARGIAALEGRPAVTSADAALAAQLVLAHRATRLPPAGGEAPDAGTTADAHEPPLPTEPGDALEPEPAAAPVGADADARAEDVDADADAGPTPAPAPAPAPQADPPADVVLEAALAALPAHLLDALRGLPPGQTRLAPAGRAGAVQKGTARGRPVGVRRAVPRGGARLALLETLRAAAPWHALRRAEAGAGPGPAVHVRREDFHVRRHALRSETVTVFVVDASGSSALHRLAEAKGAVELLLADCYVRRDSVALIAFRGRAAELLLPPTRSLARAKRSLAGLPGGGATPLAAGIDAAATLVEALRRRGTTPFVVLLTDGRGNVGRDGLPGRAAALRDALAAAQRLRLTGTATLLMDTSPQPQPAARDLAEALGARYLPLPHAGAAELSRAVRSSALVLTAAGVPSDGRAAEQTNRRMSGTAVATSSTSPDG